MNFIKRLYKSDFLKGFLAALTMLAFCAGCVHLAVSVDRDVIPDVIENKIFKDKPVVYVTNTEVDVPSVDEEGEDTVKTMKIKPRTETQKERDLQWEVESQNQKIDQLTRDHAALIKKFAAFMEIHNQTVQELTNKILPAPVKPESIKPFLGLTREELEVELDEMFGPVGDIDLLELELLDREAKDTFETPLENNEVIFDDGVLVE